MSKKKKPAPKAGANPTGTALAELVDAVDRYERGRYGSAAPSDRRKPAADAATELRRTYDDGAEPVDYAAALLSLLVAARRDGLAPDDVLAAAVLASVQWEQLGNEPHPQYPLVVPGTATAPAA